MMDVKARPLRASEMRGLARRIFLTCLSILADTVGYDGLRELEPLPEIVAEFPERGELAEFLSLDECQIEVQKTLSEVERKRYAVYYTVDEGIEVISSSASEFAAPNSIVADPFMGSGRLLSRTVERIGEGRVALAWGVEPLPLPALVALTSLVTILGVSKVKIAVGDAFSLITSPLSSQFPKADVIVTNPPFTRWRLLPKGYRERLLRLVEGLGYSGYIARREVSLQVLSMFLVDHMLREGGFLGAVLPASTFYTIYGRGFKDLLLERYDLRVLVENSESSFSLDSGFKELIILAIKGGEYGGTVMARAGDPPEELGRVD
ncbi:MAG: hypothetical protein BA066_05665, partial [Candidatus Korarchaeota archaeon NZ13-K]